MIITSPAPAFRRRALVAATVVLLASAALGTSPPATASVSSVPTTPASSDDVPTPGTTPEDLAAGARLRTVADGRQLVVVRTMTKNDGLYKDDADAIGNVETRLYRLTCENKPCTTLKVTYQFGGLESSASTASTSTTAVAAPHGFDTFDVVVNGGRLQAKLRDTLECLNPITGAATGPKETVETTTIDLQLAEGDSSVASGSYVDYFDTVATNKCKAEHYGGTYDMLIFDPSSVKPVAPVPGELWGDFTTTKGESQNSAWAVRKCEPADGSDCAAVLRENRAGPKVGEKQSAFPLEHVLHAGKDGSYEASGTSIGGCNSVDKTRWIPGGYDVTVTLRAWFYRVADTTVLHLQTHRVGKPRDVPGADVDCRPFDVIGERWTANYKGTKPSIDFSLPVNEYTPPIPSATGEKKEIESAESFAFAVLQNYAVELERQRPAVPDFIKLVTTKMGVEPVPGPGEATATAPATMHPGTVAKGIDAVTFEAIAVRDKAGACVFAALYITSSGELHTFMAPGKKERCTGSEALAALEDGLLKEVKA